MRGCAIIVRAKVIAVEDDVGTMSDQPVRLQGGVTEIQHRLFGCGVRRAGR
jgi:hypothetical protein